jgi:hypothetical protein
MDETFIFRSLLICEDFRQEVDLKQILISVYAGVIITDVVPILWPTFVIRVELMPMKKTYEAVQLRIDKPNKTTLSVFDMSNVIISDTNYPAALFFKRTPIVFDMEGSYTVTLSMDSKPVDIGNFSVAIRKPAASESPTLAPQGRRRRVTAR